MSSDEIAVSSTTYSLTGDEADRPDYLQSLILGAVLQNVDSLAQVIIKGYQNSLAVKLRSFLRWAKNDPEFQNAFGITSKQLEVKPELDLALIGINIPVDTGYTVEVNSAVIGKADLSYWVLRYLAVTHPVMPVDAEGLPVKYYYRYDANTNTVTLHWAYSELPDEVFEVSGFEISLLHPEAKYLYAHYTPIQGEVLGPITIGPWITLAIGENFPILDSSWQLQTDTSTPTVRVLRTTRTTDITYSDSRPAEHSVATTEKTQAINELHQVYEKTEYQGAGPNPQTQTYSLKSIQTQDTTFEVKSRTNTHSTTQVLPDGVTRRVTTTLETEYLSPIRKHQTSIGQIIHTTRYPAQYYIYRENSIASSPLNTLFTAPTTVDAGVFYPPIPLRFENNSITEENFAWIVDLPLSWTHANSFEELWIAPSIGRTGEAIQVLHNADRDPPSGVEGEVYSYSVIGWQDAENNPALISDVLEDMPAPVIEFRGYNSDGSRWTSGWMPLKAKARPDPESASPLAHLSPICRKAFKKALGVKFEDIQDKVLRNADLGNIDYIYAIFGVPLATKENTGRKYIFKFFENLMNTIGGPTQELNWWLNNFGKLPSGNVVRIAAEHAGISSYQVELQWAFITPTYGTGRAWIPVTENLEPGVHGQGYRNLDVGEVAFRILPPAVENENLYYVKCHDGWKSVLEMTWQLTDNSWKRLRITALEYRNLIYRGQMQRTSPYWELEEGKTLTEIIIPLHETLFEQLSSLDQMRVASNSAFLVFNCYKEFEKAWYQTTWFKVVSIAVVVVISIVVAVATGGTGTAGVFGLASEVGAALGLSGTAAIIAGAALNAIAGIVISFIVQAGITEIFGEEAGALAGLILSLVFSMGLSAANGMAAWDVFTSAQNLLSLSCAAVDGAAQVAQGMAVEIQQKTQTMLQEANRKFEEFQKQVDELNPSKRLDPTLINQFIDELRETPERFLSRTLMTGSDIVELTLDAVYGYTNRQLELALAK